MGLNRVLAPSPDDPLPAESGGPMAVTQSPFRATARRGRRTRVGLFFNLKRSRPTELGDAEAEFDSWDTISAIGDAIASFGFEVVYIEAGHDMPATFDPASIDVGFNVAEGHRGRGREGLVPALLDHYGIEYSGSDSATLCLTLDKALAKRVVAGAGVPVAPFLCMTTGSEPLAAGMTFPLVVKPVAEGSSKGVTAASVVRDRAELRARVRELHARYGQAALVEAFLPGREFTLGVLGARTLRVLPIMEVVFTEPDVQVYGFEQKQSSRGVRFDVPAEIDAALARELRVLALSSFRALGCRDVARLDVRLDARNQPCFIECNPLPGLTPNWSDLCVLAQAAGLDHRALIGEILMPAVRRARRARVGVSATLVAAE